MPPSPGPTMTRLISLRTSCTGATMSTHAAWTPATRPRAPRGGASPARSTTPCAGPTVSRARANPWQPQPPHLGSGDPGAQGCACPASLPTDLPRTPLAYSSGACSPLPSSLPCPRHSSSRSILTSCCHTDTQGRRHTPQGLCTCGASSWNTFSPHTYAAPPPPTSVLLSNVLAAPPACSEKYTTFLQGQLVQSLSCVRLCNPMDCRTPDLPAHRQLPEFTQTHVH